MKRDVCTVSFAWRAFFVSDGKAAKGTFPQFLSPSAHFRSASNDYKYSKGRFESGFADNISKVDDAVRLYRQMVRMRPLPSVIDFTQLLDRVAKLEEYGIVISLYKHMCDTRIPMDEVTMNIVINSSCLLGDVDSGFSLLGCFFKGGHAPNFITYTSLLRGLFSENRVREALELFEKIVNERVCEPNEVMYGVVIDGLCRNGCTSTAINMLRYMGNGICKPNVVVYTSVIDSLSKDEMHNEAIALLDEMVEKGLSPNVVTYTSLIHGLFKLGKRDEAIKLFNEMKLKISPNILTYNILLSALCKEGEMDCVEQLVAAMIQRGEKADRITYYALVRGYCLQGRIEEAYRVFDTMVSLGFDPDVAAVADRGK